jgi:hypothetical protein
MKHTTIVFLLLAGGWLMAQANPGQSGSNKQEQVTVQGCVSRSSGDYVLTLLDPGNSYVLRSANNNVKLGHLLTTLSGAILRTTSRTSIRA